MNQETRDEVRTDLIKAADAMHQKNKADAFAWASKAARLAPETEEPWLIMAAVSNPQASLQYLNQALKINPQSQKARQGIIWATKRLQPTEAPNKTIKIQPSAPAQTLIPVDKTQQIQLIQTPSRPKTHPRWVNILLFWVGLFVIFCTSTVAISAFASNWMITNRTPQAQVAYQQGVRPYQTPTITLIPTSTNYPTQTPSPTLTSVPTETATHPPFSTPIAPTDPPIVIAIPVTPLPTLIKPVSQYESAPQYNPGNGERWIDVNLSQQKLYAYEGNSVANVFLMSSGVAAHPTVTGQYHIYVKYRFDDMRGPGYFLPNVPYVMYFFEGYGIHGTYWHNNFGHPMSHGCVNLSIPDSAWMYDWASEGTLVNIHY